MELSFSQWALGCLWVEIKRLLKYGNSWGWLECKPGAVFIAQCSRWLFHLLITVWSGEMNGSYLRWNNNPPWNPSWIGTAQDDTKKTSDKGRALSPEWFYLMGPIATCQNIQDKVEIFIHWLQNAEDPVFQWNSGVDAHFTRQASLSSNQNSFSPYNDQSLLNKLSLKFKDNWH